MIKKQFLLIASLFILMASSANASTINFDDGLFPDPVAGATHYDYEGFTWYNLEKAFDNTTLDLYTNHEALSDPYALKSSSSMLRTFIITRNNPSDKFYFDGISGRIFDYLPNKATAVGMLGGNAQYSVSGWVYLNYMTYSNTQFNNSPIDSLVISWQSPISTPSVANIDNFKYHLPCPVPEPTSMITGAIAAVIGLLNTSRRRS